MFRKLLAAGVVAAGVGIAGTASEAEAGDRHHRGGHHHHGGWSGGHHHHHHHHHGGYRGGRMRIQPFPYYGGGFRRGGYYGAPWGGRHYGGSGLYIQGRNFSFGYVR